MNLHLRDVSKLGPLRIVTGVLLSIGAALLASVAFAGRPSSAMLPFIFVVVLVLLAGRYGVVVSIIGSACAALIFAHFLYAPVGSVRVESDAERSSLAYMVLLAISVSYLLFPGSEMRNRKH